jgi:hypothetical protein
MWVEYARNTLPCSATGLSPFKCLMGYHPLLFPEQEEEVSLPSAQMFSRPCCRTWKRARSALKTISRFWRQAATGPLLPAIVEVEGMGVHSGSAPLGGILQTLAFLHL